MGAARTYKGWSQQWDKVAAFTFGVVFVAVMLVVSLYVPNPTDSQFFVFRVVLAAAAAGVGAVIPGLIKVNVGGHVRAGGAIALFVVIYWFNPPKLISTPQKVSLIEQHTAGADSPIVSGSGNTVKIDGDSAAPKTENRENKGK